MKNKQLLFLFLGSTLLVSCLTLDRDEKKPTVTEEKLTAYIQTLPTDMQYFPEPRIPEKENAFPLILEIQDKYQAPNKDLDQKLNSLFVSYGTFPPQEQSEEIVAYINNNRFLLKLLDKMTEYKKCQFPEFYGPDTSISFYRPLDFTNRLKIINIKYLYAQKEYDKATLEVIKLFDLGKLFLKNPYSIVNELIAWRFLARALMVANFLSFQPDFPVKHLKTFLEEIPEFEPGPMGMSKGINVDLCRSFLWHFAEMEGSKKAQLDYLMRRLEKIDNTELRQVLAKHPNLFNSNEAIKDIVATVKEVKENCSRDVDDFVWEKRDKIKTRIKPLPALLKYFKNPKSEKNNVFDDKGKLKPEVIEEYYAYKNPVGRLRYLELAEFLHAVPNGLLIIKTRAEMTRLNLALQIYFKKHGKYPERSLNLVKNGIIKEAPKDFFNDQEPLQYSRKKHILWSHGTNGEDDDAVGYLINTTEGRDWVFDFTPFNSATSLNRAIYEDDKYAVKNLLATYKYAPDVTDFLGFTPIHTAVNRKIFPLLKSLLKHGFEPNKRDSYGNAPIHNCIKAGNLEYLKFLVDNGADPSFTFKNENIELLPLALAAYRKSNVPTLEYLLSKGVDINAVDNKYGGSALSLAAGMGNVDNTKFLLKQGAKVNSKELKNPPLYSASAKKDNSEVVKMLLEKKAEINFQSPQSKMTALMEAVAVKDPTLVKLLLARGADPNIKANDGKTALHIATASGGKEEIIKMLLDAGANVNAEMKFLFMSKITPLLFATRYYGPDILQALLDKGANINFNEHGQTPLMNALMTKKYDNVKFMLKRGAKADTQTKDGNTPLLQAIKTGRLDVVKAMHKAGMPLNKQTKKGTLPIFFACALGKIDIVKYMAENGVDLKARNGKDVTPLITAVLGGKVDLIKYLIQAGCDINHKVYKPGTPFHNHTALSLAKQFPDQQVIDLLESRKALDSKKAIDFKTTTVKMRVEDKGKQLVIGNPVTGYLHRRNGIENHLVNWHFYLTPDEEEELDVGSLLSKIFSDSTMKLSDDIKTVGKKDLTVAGHPAKLTILDIDSGKMLLYVCQWNCDKSQRQFVSAFTFLNKNRVPAFTELQQHINCHLHDFDYRKYTVNPVPQETENWLDDSDDEVQVYMHNQKELVVLLYRGYNFPYEGKMFDQKDLIVKMLMEIFKNANLLEIKSHKAPEKIKLLNKDAIRINCQARMPDVEEEIQDCDIVVWQNKDNQLHYFGLIFAEEKKDKKTAYKLLSSIKYEMPKQLTEKKKTHGLFPDKTKSKKKLLDKEGKENLKYNLEREIKGGFYKTVPEAIQRVIERFSDEYEEVFLKPVCQKMSQEIISKLNQNAKKWPKKTDCDRLNAAFAELEKKGVVARQNFSCCGSCGAGEIRDEIKKEQKAGKKIRGYVFFHEQDTDSAVDGEGLYFCYGSTKEGTKAALAIANEIADTLKKHGLKTDWDGTWDKRISAELKWQKRGPWLGKNKGN